MLLAALCGGGKARGALASRMASMIHMTDNRLSVGNEAYHKLAV